MWVLPKSAESVVNYSYNGTEYSFVSKDPAQIEDLKCAVCLQLVFEPVLTSCGHLFRQNCVAGQKTCPTCRCELQYTRDHFNERRVKSLKVKCPNWERDVNGRETWETLHSTQVPTARWRPSLVQKVARKDSKGTFEQPCCSLCSESLQVPTLLFYGTFANVVTTHFSSCYSFPLACPAGCRNRYSRKQMASHLAECAEELVPCTYASICCQEVIRRRQFQAHMDDKKDYHFQQVMEMVTQLGMAVPSTRLTAAGGATSGTNWLLCLQNTLTCYPRPRGSSRWRDFKRRRRMMKNGSVILCTLILEGKRCASVCMLMELGLEKTLMCLYTPI